MYLTHYVQAILLLFSVAVVIIATAVYVFRETRKTNQENKEHARMIAMDILNSSRTPGRWRWISDDKFQFVYLVLGKIPGEHWSWARVTVEREVITVDMECDYRIDYIGMSFTESVVSELRNLGAIVNVVSGMPQPDLKEVHVSDNEQII